ncbi:putative ubiquitin conjugating enzyme E2-like protein [Leptotrombidium deliense]|uniref:Putative ubiquitin conjugating enzyme E2-like protein n=1 Tax=Leptotrombidium deliense TaxID=299467 RepID=A0A443S3F6_9ACAR|nr:putative ubiquitin conjugating enzyme E2-like protein [Leptotrombidium deliense]
MNEINVLINGAEGSPYEGGNFNGIIPLSGYHSTPPNVQFATRIDHHNVSNNGYLCLDILTPEKWKSTFDIKFIILSMIHLMAHPNGFDYLNEEAAQLFMKDIDAFDKAREVTSQFATDHVPNENQ